MWKTWLTVQRERSFDLCFVTDTKAHLQWQFFSVSMYERELLICLFDLTTCRKCLSEKPEKLVDTGNNGRLVSKRCLLVILKQFFVKCCTFSVISSFLFHYCDWSRKRAPSLSTNQLSVASNLSLLFFCFTSLCDWSIKLAPPFHPIKWKTKINPNMVTCVFPRFKQVACFYFEFIIG